MVNKLIVEGNYGEFNIVNSNIEFEKDIAFKMEKTGVLAGIIQGGPGFFYGRMGHPNTKQLEEVLRLAEAGDAQGLDAAVFSSGMAVINTVIESLVEDGKRFIAGNNLYFSTKDLLGQDLPKGMKPTIFVDTSNPENVRLAIEEHKNEIAAIYFEPVTNPKLSYTDTRAIRAIAPEALIVVDNTFLTPYLQQPLRMGADVVIHSLTKYLNGEGDLMGGVVIADEEIIKKLKEIRTTKGAILSHRDAYLVAERISSLPQRMVKHCTNAVELSDYLSRHEKVDEVYYPKLGNQTRNGWAGGVVSFRVHGNNDNERIKVEHNLIEHIIKANGPIQYRVSLGHPETLILGDYSLGFDKKFMMSYGIPTGLIRVAVGRDDIKEVKKHLDYALKHA